MFLPHFFLGIFLAATFLLQWWRVPSYPLAIWIACGTIGVAGLILLTARRTMQIAWMLLAAAIAIAIAFWSMQRVSMPASAALMHLTESGAAVTISGVVRDLPDDRQTRIRYVLDVPSVHDRVQLTDRAMNERYLPGDVIQVRGIIKQPSSDERFDEKTYLAMNGIHAVIDSRDVERTGTDVHALMRILWTMRRWFENRISDAYPEPAASLLAGLLTGSTSGMPQSLQDDFRATGLSHLVAISGSNITIILSIMGGMLFFLPLRWRLVPCIIGIALFTLFVGAEASVVRAAIMGVIGLFALQTGRLKNARLTVLWTAFIMLAINPLRLGFDGGFQLSFLAVVGLIELQPILKPLLARVPDVAGLTEALLTTIVAELAAMPWGAYAFGSLPVIGPVANILAGPVVPLAMLCGFIGVIAHAVDPVFGSIFGLPGLLALEWIIGVARVSADLPLASIDTTGMSTTVIGGYYLLLIMIVFWLRRSVLLCQTGSPVQSASSSWPIRNHPPASAGLPANMS